MQNQFYISYKTFTKEIENTTTIIRLGSIAREMLDRAIPKMSNFSNSFIDYQKSILCQYKPIRICQTKHRFPQVLIDTLTFKWHAHAYVCYGMYNIIISPNCLKCVWLKLADENR